jgi:4-hydroxybenzoate polyprenyltransferase
MSQDVPQAPVVASEALFVDLDGTLIASDMVWESLFLAIRRQPLVLFKLLFWLARGRAYMKHKLAERVTPQVNNLPYRQEVIDFLKQQRARGTEVVLATASHQSVAQKVGEHLGLFVDCLGTDGGANLKGSAKLARIEAYCREHGFTEFSYIGDTWADIPIWKRAKHVYAVAPSATLVAALQRLGTSTPEILVRRRSTAIPLLRALRPQQWLKNLLLAVPLVLAHKMLDANRLFLLGLAIFAFCACASAVYLINDLFDLEADRTHPTKRRRPLAAGTLPVPYALPLIATLMTLAFGISFWLLPLDFSGLLAVYVVANFCYSMWLKRKPMIDVLMLAGMYTLRVLAGGVAVDVPISEWLLAFSAFFFISLAFVKRYSELIKIAQTPEKSRAEGRGYRVSDIAMIESMGPCSGYLAVLVLALYMNSPQVEQLYTNRAPLWLVCMLMLYWVSRLWFWAKRGELLEDPVVFVATDRVSLMIATLSFILILAAAWGS